MSAVPARRRPATWLTLALLAVALGMVGFMFASAMLPGHERLSVSVDSVMDIPLIAASVSAFLALTGVGALLAVLRPRSPIGWILLVGGVGLILQDFVPAYVERSTLVAPLPGYQVAGDATRAFAALAIPLLTVWLPLLFPDGRLPGPRWRVVGAIAVVYTVVAVALTLVPEPEQPVVSLVAGGLIAAAVVALIVRFRRTRGTERQQVKWFLAAIALLVAAMLVLAVLQNSVGWALMLLALAFLPIAIGIAILRYRLYDIDRLISRTIGWALVTGILAAVFVGVVIALQALLAGVTQGETLAVAASTLAAFALFQPLRRRTQQVVDRRFDRARYDGQRTVDEFSEQLRDKVRTPDINRDIRRVIHDTVRPAHLGVWLRSGGGGVQPRRMGRADEETA